MQKGTIKREAFRMLDWLVYAGGLAFFGLYAVSAWGLGWAILGLVVFIAIAVPALGFLQAKLRIKPSEL